jgi:glucokinase
LEEVVMKVLAGDIGGTNARLAVYEIELTRYKTLVAETFPSREHETLEGVVAGFMKGHGIRCQRACFGVPDDQPPVAGRDLEAGNRCGR